MKLRKIFTVIPGICFLMIVSTPTVISAQTPAIHDVYWPDSIQGAIDDANPGDTILVHEGEYGSERIFINKDYITLIGNSAIIDGTALTGQGDGLVNITTGVQGVTIDGFEIRNFEYGINCGNGIFVQNYCSNNVIRNNIIYSVNGAGIFLAEDSSCNLITGNNISASSNGVGANYSHSNQVIGNITSGNIIGIFMGNGCSNNTISDNNDSASDCGINIGGAINNQVYKNVISNSLEGIWIGTDDLNGDSRDNMVTDNLIIGSSVVGLFLGNANNNHIFQNTFTGDVLDEARGIVLGQDHAGVSPSTNIIEDNKISYYRTGIVLGDGAFQNVVINNDIDSSTRSGIVLVQVTNNDIKENLICNSKTYGIAVAFGSANNTIKENKVKKSEEFDLFDIGLGTNNTWIENKYKTSNFS